jgi:hypothetical protein
VSHTAVLWRRRARDSPASVTRGCGSKQQAISVPASVLIMTNMHVSRMNRNVGESQPRCGSIRGVALVALALWGYANTLLARRLGRGRCGSCSVSCFGYSRTCNGPRLPSSLPPSLPPVCGLCRLETPCHACDGCSCCYEVDSGAHRMRRRPVGVLAILSVSRGVSILGAVHLGCLNDPPCPPFTSHGASI